MLCVAVVVVISTIAIVVACLIYLSWTSALRGPEKKVGVASIVESEAKGRISIVFIE